MFHIPEIKLYPTFHLAEFRGLAPGAVDLGPARYAWLDLLADIIIPDQLRIVIIMCKCVRARTNEGHIASKNVHKLRKLVNTGASKPATNPRNTTVTAPRLLYHSPVLENDHRSKLEDLEGLSMQASPCLSKEDRPRRVELDHDSDCEEEGKANQKGAGRNDQVNCVLRNRRIGPPIDRVARLLWSRFLMQDEIFSRRIHDVDLPLVYVLIFDDPPAKNYLRQRGVRADNRAARRYTHTRRPAEIAANRVSIVIVGLR